MEQTTLSKYVKFVRKQYNLTQIELSEKSGVGLRFVRELEQGKQTLRLDKVNQVLSLFGCEVGVVPITKSDEQWSGLCGWGSSFADGYHFRDLKKMIYPTRFHHKLILTPRKQRNPVMANHMAWFCKGVQKR